MQYVGFGGDDFAAYGNVNSQVPVPFGCMLPEINLIYRQGFQMLESTIGRQIKADPAGSRRVFGKLFNLSDRFEPAKVVDTIEGNSSDQIDLSALLQDRK